jgi:hypothetical protein
MLLLIRPADLLLLPICGLAQRLISWFCKTLVVKTVGTVEHCATQSWSLRWPAPAQHLFLVIGWRHLQCATKERICKT